VCMSFRVPAGSDARHIKSGLRETTLIFCMITTP
jgi:hypothetical protein